MHLRRSAVVLTFVMAVIVLPLSSVAAEAPITRRAAFIQIWQSVNRPAQQTREKPFADVQAGSEGYLEITFAKRRGMIDSAAAFQPNDPLDLQTALLWLFRTKNVIEHDRITVENFPLLLKRYPLLDGLDGVTEGSYSERSLTKAELTQLIDRLKQLMDKEVHLVTYYGDAFHGKGTAYGETYNMYALTAAHRSFPYNTVLRVTNIKNGKSVVVRVNDTGPWVKPGHKYYDKLNLDLSMAAFQQISDTGHGVEQATIERLGDVSAVDASLLGPAEQRESVRGQFCTGGDTSTQTRLANGVELSKGVPLWLRPGGTLELSAHVPFQVIDLRLPSGAVQNIGSRVEADQSFSKILTDVGGYRLTLATQDGKRRVYGIRVTDCQ